MSTRNRNSKIWLVIGVLVLVVLLFLWLTEAFSVGDTDVNAPEELSYIQNAFAFLNNIA